MWKYFANKLLRNRLAFIIVLGLLTVFMAYRATKIQLSYEFAKILPESDVDYKEYEKFKELFGEDGSVMVIGVRDSGLFKLETFNDWFELSNSIKKMDGVQETVSLATIFNINSNDSLQRFEFVPVMKSKLKSQQELDSLQKVIHELPFYNNLIYNKESGATLLAITMKKADLNSKNRLKIVGEIKSKGEEFSKKHNIELHYSGMPFVRTAIMKKVSGEMELFLLLGLVITGIILWAFFKSVKTVFYAIIVVVVGVIWSMGTIELLNYKITILTGLIPPLILVIGVPNCIFLINKYHSEYSGHRNKVKALTRMITTIGVSLFLANVTTAIGFAVLFFTNSVFLAEFGVIAALNVMLTYLIALIFVPVILSYLPVPKDKEIMHLDGKRINRVLAFIDHIVHNYRRQIYGVIAIITIISIVGMMKIDFTGYVVDDLPAKDTVSKDLRFFETYFNGVLPFEIFIDTGEPDGVFKNSAIVLYKMNRLQKMLDQYPEFSKGMSVVDVIKFSYQSYRGGPEKYYVLPGVDELKKLSQYEIYNPFNDNKANALMDSTRQFVRISYQMADVGSTKIKTLLADIQPRVDSVFTDTNYKVKLTGHSLLFLKSNDYLLGNLLESLLIEIILIALVGLALFRSVRIIILSKIPCLIPLIITAGIMGFLDIRFKPSTILIFSIAFGIASDGTIYFLAKYRQELKIHKSTISKAVSVTIMDTGLSMIYTAIILFFGFGIFAASDFGGIAALGILISITLLVSVITNLILLPCILISIDKYVSKKEILSTPLVELEDEEEK